MKLRYVVIFSIILAVVLQIVSNYLINNPVTVPHPYPVIKKLKAYSIVEKIDKTLWLTAGINWYRVKNKETGEVHLVGVNPPTHGWRMIVVDNNTREYIGVYNEDEYLSLYEDKEKTAHDEVCVKVRVVGKK